MVAHDELFCRLAIRHGFLDQPTGVEILRRYREEGRHGETIDQFVLEEGYLDEAATAQLENAIHKRAAGHVTEEGPRRRRTKGGKKVPNVKTGAGAVRHHHHTPAMPRTVKSSPTQLAISGGAVLVLVVMVIVLIVNMQSPTNVADTATGANRDDSSKTANTAPEATIAKATYEARVLTDEEIQKLKASLSQVIANTNRESVEFPIRAITQLENWRMDNGGDEHLPVDLRPELEEAIKRAKEYLGYKYEDLYKEYQEAKEGDNAALIADILQEIERRCGKDYAEKAEKGEGPSEE